MTVQEGVHFQAHNRKPACMAALFLRFREATTPAQASAVLHDLWALIAGLKQGQVPELREADLDARLPEPTLVPAGGLKVLFGFGARQLRGEQPAILRNAVSAYLRSLPSRPMRTDFGYPARQQPFGSNLLAFDRPYKGQLADSDVVFQFTGDDDLAVSRALVEVEQRLASQHAFTTSVSYATKGFSRSDKRGWFGFHDGINNLKRSERPEVIALPKPRYNAAAYTGGTFMSFMKLETPLEAWRARSVNEQEALIGRKKSSGVEFERRQGINLPNGAGPVTPGPLRNPEFVHGKQFHIHRARRNGTQRMFRQGYEFHEWDETAMRSVVGLNFVAFHRTPNTSQFVVSDSEWLGGSALGDDGSLATLRAVGLFFVPPRRGDGELPGQELLRS